MSHDVEYINDNELSALTIRHRNLNSAGATEARITKLGGVGGGHHRGIKIKPRRANGDGEAPGPIEIFGEDLYALREFLAELPEEVFVRPADPVVKPERWNDGDILEERNPEGRFWVWVRRNGVWNAVDARSSNGDQRMSAYVGGFGFHAYTVVRQKSGQDV